MSAALVDILRVLISVLGVIGIIGIILFLITAVCIFIRERKSRRDKAEKAKRAEKSKEDFEIIGRMLKLEQNDRVQRKVTSIRQRIFEDDIRKGDVVDIVVNEGYESEFEELSDNISEEYVQRQSRVFFSCALNLMAHSYGSIEEVRKVAKEMIDKELADV